MQENIERNNSTLGVKNRLKIGKCENVSSTATDKGIKWKENEEDDKIGKWETTEPMKRKLLDQPDPVKSQQ
jgi:hypothetical protein